ncbi:hypothetical protein SBADM41S_04267 [Streptomyces badius]
MGQPESRENRGAEQSELPPGQRLQRGWPVTHYGPVPKFKPDRWEFRVFGATADGDKHCWSHQDFSALPFSSVVADLHCVTKFSMLGAEWGGVPASAILELAPPAADATHVMVWAEYGFSSNLRLADFASERTLFATHKDGELLYSASRVSASSSTASCGRTSGLRAVALATRESSATGSPARRRTGPGRRR